MIKALICVDYIAEIVGESGKLAEKGYYYFVQKHNTLSNLARLQDEFRCDGAKVIHVHLGFAPDYSDHPAKSPLLGGARTGEILRLGTPSVAIVEPVSPKQGDVVIVKKRISAFFGTGLDETLKSLGVTDLFIAGVATDLAVQSAARDAHDRDYAVTIVASSCAAASDADHEAALATLAKFAKVA